MSIGSVSLCKTDTSSSFSFTNETSGHNELSFQHPDVKTHSERNFRTFSFPTSSLNSVNYFFLCRLNNVMLLVALINSPIEGGDVRFTMFCRERESEKIMYPSGGRAKPHICFHFSLKKDEDVTSSLPLLTTSLSFLATGSVSPSHPVKNRRKFVWPMKYELSKWLVSKNTRAGFPFCLCFRWIFSLVGNTETNGSSLTETLSLQCVSLSCHLRHPNVQTFVYTRKNASASECGCSREIVSKKEIFMSLVSQQTWNEMRTSFETSILLIW